MPDTQPDSTDVEIMAPVIERPASTAIMTTDQFDSTWRMSKALAASGSFKDIGKDEGSKALARIMLGADLGMSPTQALMGIDIVKGNPQIRGVALGRMVRNTAKKPTPVGESYDYAVLDRGFGDGEEYAVVALYRRDEDGSWPRVDEPNGETFPTSIGPVTIAKGRKLPEAVEAFKLDQARKRKLIRDDGAWGTQPEVMVVWRALSQLVRFYAPDVIGGVPVYTEADSFAQTITDGQGSGQMPEWALTEPSQLGAVEAVIARAKSAGHAGYSAEATIRMRLNGQPREVVKQWIEDANLALDAMEPPEADVVPDDPVDAPESDGPATDATSLTFGGETFTFGDSVGHREDVQTITEALADDDADACERVAMLFMNEVDGFEGEPGDLVDRYRAMAEAMHAEAEKRRGVIPGQTEIEF